MSTSPTTSVTLPANESPEPDEALASATTTTPSDDDAVESDPYYALPCTD